MPTPRARPPRLAASALAGVLALFMSACQPGAPGDLSRFQKGEFEQLDFSQDLPLPPSPFVDAEGKARTFAEWKGKTIVFNVWAEWCAACVDEMPTLAALQKAFPEGDVVVIPIAFGDPEARTSARDKLASLVGEDLPFFYDDTFNVTYDARTGSFPSTIIYGASGVEAARLLYPADWGSKRAIDLVKSVRDAAAG